MPIKVTWNDIVKLLQQGEGPTIEFVPQVQNPQDLAKVIVSFANAQGGTIVAGIDDKNWHLNGVDVSKEWVNAVCKDECEPAISASVGEILRNEKKILVLQVKEGSNKPYRTVDGNVLTREGSKTREASTEEQKELNPWGVGGINPRQKKALNYITEQGSISNKQYREICEVSHKTAHIELTELVEKGVLSVEGQGRSTVYVLAQKESTAPAVESSREQQLPANGQLFQFEEDVEVEPASAKATAGKEKKEEIKEEVKNVPKAKTAVKRAKKPKIAKIVKEEVKEIKADIPEKKAEEEESFEPPVKKDEEIVNGEAEEEIEKKEEPPVISGDDYEDTSVTAKEPDIEEEDDAASPSFLDL